MAVIHIAFCISVILLDVEIIIKIFLRKKLNIKNADEING